MLLNSLGKLEQLVVSLSRSLAFLMRNFDANDTGKTFHRIDEAHVIVIHQKAQRGTVRAAAEAMVKTL